MKWHTGAATSGALLSLALLAACSKPAQTTRDAAADTAATTGAMANNAADAGANAAAPGGAVSPPPADGNEAINADANRTDAGASAGSNSFTEAQARGHLENAGYTDVSALTKTPDGLWTGKAKKGGKTESVAVDFKGAITTR